MTFKVLPPEFRGPEDPRDDFKGALLIDGEPAPEIVVAGYNQELTVVAPNGLAAKRITKTDIGSLPKNVAWWVFELETSIPWLTTVEVNLPRSQSAGIVGPTIRFGFDLNLDDWKGDWSAAEYRNAVQLAAATSSLTLQP